MKLALSQVAEYLGLAAEVAAEDREISGWSIDSRTLLPGDLFFALRGPVHDGHEFIPEAFRKGAAAVVANRDAPQCGGAAAQGLVLGVEDSIRALEQVAARARERWGGDVVAVTGSAGKTTTKDVIAEMLSEGMRTAKNDGNLNNQIGLPLSLLRLDEDARVAVLEMGMNHAGEIRALAAVARPQAGVVTNVGWAHAENFDSIEGIAAAKRELIESLPSDGTAVLNADDPRAAGFRSAHSGRTVLYGQSADADVRAVDVSYTLDGVSFSVGQIRFDSPLCGRHGISNLLAGIAVAGLYGITPDRLTERARKMRPARMRGERFQWRGALVYDDCYNSNPDAVRAMLDLLRDTPAQRRIAVLGEMLELGRWAEPLHRDVGSYAVRSGINVLVGIRGVAGYMLDAAKRAGLRADAAFFFDDPAQAGQLVAELLRPGDAILFKGSRGVRVERALERFLAHPSMESVAPNGEGAR